MHAASASSPHIYIFRDMKARRLGGLPGCPRMFHLVDAQGAGAVRHGGTAALTSACCAARHGGVKARAAGDHPGHSVDCSRLRRSSWSV